jgi:pimeloyl-ACP methyl ester carboxylesterase
MWRGLGRTGEDGPWEEIPFRELHGEITRERIAAEVRELVPGVPVLGAFEHELDAEGPLPGIDGIERWGARVAELGAEGVTLTYRRLGRTDEGDDIFGLSLIDRGETTAIAFHTPEAIVADVSGVSELSVVDVDGVTAPSIASPFAHQEAVLECRLYLGNGSFVAEEDVPFEDDPGAGPRRARLTLPDVPGFVVGRVARWMGKEQEPSRDPWFGNRLAYFEREHGAIAAAYPDLGPSGDPSALSRRPRRGPALVYVHGTFASALPALSLLHPLGIARAYRFEHDTFQPLMTNVGDLSKAIRRELAPGRLHLVGHSRGGLVARMVARRLADDYDVSVRTYGTPHRGTPVANMGGKMLKAVLAIGRVAAGGVFAWDPVSMGAKWLLRARDLPDGLRVMRLGSEALNILNDAPDAYDLRSYAGVYDVNGLAHGFCSNTLRTIVREAFAGKPTDMVVGLKSAQGVGRRFRIVGSCDHFQFFSDDGVCDELRRLT